MEIKINLPINGTEYGTTKPRKLEMTVCSNPESYGNDLDPAQARTLAAALTRAADAVEAHSGAQAEVDAIVRGSPLASYGTLAREPGIPCVMRDDGVMVARDSEPARSPDGIGHDLGSVQP